jgi:polyisoprenoid-binding protein YceI
MPSIRTFERDFLLALVTFGCLLPSGCSDPADDVPKAPGSSPATAAGVNPGHGKEYLIRAESKIEFVGSKVTGSHDGGFKNFAGTLRAADGRVVGLPVIRINMNSIWADNDRLTGHLKSGDFFDVANYPTATFTVTAIEPAGSQHQVTGNLELHGVTKSISFPADLKVTDQEVTLKAEFAINRKDFNINYPGKPDDLIRDNVVIRLDIRATPGPARAEDQLALIRDFNFGV